jgi:imidazoleglycerol-phosphate dehydratase
MLSSNSDHNNASKNRRGSLTTTTSLFTTTQVVCVDLKKVSEGIHTGIGFLDHMMDQIYSHGQIGVGMTVHHHSDLSNLSGTATTTTTQQQQQPTKPTSSDNNNNNSNNYNNYNDEDDEEKEEKEEVVMMDDNNNTNDKKKTNGNTDQKSHLLHNHLSESHVDQASLLRHVGWTLGCQVALLNKFLALAEDATSRFCCPLDEALVECLLVKPSSNASAAKRRKLHHNDNDNDNNDNDSTTIKPVGDLVQYELAPFGKYGSGTAKGGGRTKIGHLETSALQEFWKAFAKATGLQISLLKVRGDNGHHIVEATFKAFARAMRNLLDGTDTSTSGGSYYASLWGPASFNYKTSFLQPPPFRQGRIERATKETNIQVSLVLDGGVAGTAIQTGISMLDEFLTALAQEACMSLTIQCAGDLWVDEHHTAEDVAIAVGQVLVQALGTKAGLNRMWCAQQPVPNCNNLESIEVTMDLSNRPCLVHNLGLEEDGQEEMVDDLSVEMLDHVLESLVSNGRITVHIVRTKKKDTDEQQGGIAVPNSSLKDRAMATAMAFGRAFKHCAMVDSRRAGLTASSKGTLSV